MSKTIGIIAEDNSDIDVIENILAKYTQRNQFSIKRWVGNGCAKLRSKCGIWTDTLFQRGCEHVLIFHDLDRNIETELRKTLLAKIPPAKFPKSVIVIPIEEMEAWLLSDSNAIKRTFNLKKLPKKVSNCECVSSPKEHLAGIVWTLGKKRYLNTIHNKSISEHATLENFRRCNSFKSFDRYVLDKILFGS